MHRCRQWHQFRLHSIFSPKALLLCMVSCLHGLRRHLEGTAIINVYTCAFSAVTSRIIYHEKRLLNQKGAFFKSNICGFALCLCNDGPIKKGFKRLTSYTAYTVQYAHSFTLALWSSTVEIYHLYSYNLKGILCLWISIILTPTPSCEPVACSGFCEPGEPLWCPSAPQVPHAAATCSEGSGTLIPDRTSPLPGHKAHQSWQLWGVAPGTQGRNEGPVESRSELLVQGCGS